MSDQIIIGRILPKELLRIKLTAETVNHRAYHYFIYLTDVINENISILPKGQRDKP